MCRYQLSFIRTLVTGDKCNYQVKNCGYFALFLYSFPVKRYDEVPVSLIFQFFIFLIQIAYFNCGAIIYKFTISFYYILIMFEPQIQFVVFIIAKSIYYFISCCLEKELQTFYVIRYFAH